MAASRPGRDRERSVYCIGTPETETDEPLSLDTPSVRGDSLQVWIHTSSFTRSTRGGPAATKTYLAAETLVVRKNWNCALIVTSFIAIHETHFIGRRLRPPVEKKFPPPRIWASGRDLVPLMRPRRSKLPLSPLCCPPIYAPAVTASKRCLQRRRIHSRML